MRKILATEEQYQNALDNLWYLWCIKDPTPHQLELMDRLEKELDAYERIR